MAEIMMALGPFRFQVDTAAYQKLSRTVEYRWPVQERMGRLPARQFTGPGNDTIDLDGVIYPHFAGSPGQIQTLREIAGNGEALILVDGRGRVWGKWCLERIEERQMELLGGLPRKIEFRLSLCRYGDDA